MADGASAVTQPEVTSATARSGLYSLLVEPYRFPSPDSTAEFIAGRWQERVRDIVATLPYPLSLPEGLQLRSTPDDFQVEFIRIHEVGMGGAPCPLHGGHYARDRMLTMEEAARFYSFFAFPYQRTADIFPDHVTIQLAFMSHLVELQGQALSDSGDVLSPVLAQRDFLGHQLQKWLPRLRDGVCERSELRFCCATAQLLTDFVDCERQHVNELVRRHEQRNGGVHHGV